jgi:phage terminase small subunit
MGRRGPAPKPTKLVVLEGNPGKRPLPKNEPKPSPCIPNCPAWLLDDAKALWKTLAPELDRISLFTTVDGVAFAVLCQTFARWKQADQAGSEHGDRLAVKYVAQVKALCQEFGLTPSARTRISVKTPEVDDLDALLSR